MSFYDTDGDGINDVGDLDQDGIIDAVDTNADGMWDQIDIDGDGVADFADVNGDGLIEMADGTGLDQGYGVDASYDSAGTAYDPTESVDLDGDGYADAGPTYTDAGYAQPDGVAQPGGYAPDPYAASTGPFDPTAAAGGQGQGIDLNGDGMVDGFDTDGDGWIDAVGPGAEAAAVPGPPGGVASGGGNLPPAYTQAELDAGYSQYDTSFIEPGRFADDTSLISDNDTEGMF